MSNEHNTNYMEEDDFKTPQVSKKNKNKTKTKTPIEPDNNTIDIKVKQIYEKPDRISPIIAYFPSAYNPISQDSPNVTVYENKNQKKKRLEVVVSPPGLNVEYIGSTHNGEQSARQTCVYTLGVLDKETKTLKILPIAYNKIFRLDPKVKTTETVVVSEEQETTDITEKERLETARINLLKGFGTKDAIKKDKKRHNLNLNEDPDTQKSNDGKLKKVKPNQSALDSTSSVITHNIPPYNLSAERPEQAYPLEKIIDKGEWSFLEDIYKFVQKGAKEVVPDSYLVFVRNRLERVREIDDEDEKKTVCGVLSFITHLVKFKERNSMNFQFAKDHKFPAMISQKCKRLFNESDLDRMTAEKINLLLSYVLVLTLHVDDFKTDLEDIAKDLRLSVVELRKHVENLGCKISRSKTSSIATLKVPLKFPEIRRFRRKG